MGGAAGLAAGGRGGLAAPRRAARDGPPGGAGAGPAVSLGGYALIFPAFLLSVMFFLGTIDGILGRYLVLMYAPLLLFALFLLDGFVRLPAPGLWRAVKRGLTAAALIGALAWFAYGLPGGLAAHGAGGGVRAYRPILQYGLLGRFPHHSIPAGPTAGRHGFQQPLWPAALPAGDGGGNCGGQAGIRLCPSGPPVSMLRWPPRGRAGRTAGGRPTGGAGRRRRPGLPGMVPDYGSNPSSHYDYAAADLPALLALELVAELPDSRIFRMKHQGRTLNGHCRRRGSACRPLPRLI